MWKLKKTLNFPTFPSKLPTMSGALASPVPSRYAVPARPTGVPTPRWKDTILLLLDSKYSNNTPTFISRQVTALRLLAIAVDHDLTVIFDYLPIQNKLASLSGQDASKEVDRLKLLAIDKAKSNKAHHVAYILEPVSYSRMNDMDISGYGYCIEHLESKIHLIITCNNSRALAHEYLHAIGYNKSRFHNTQPFNLIHNNKFEDLMDSAGCAKTTYPKDY